jgi:hypothetical protein
VNFDKGVSGGVRRGSKRISVIVFSDRRGCSTNCGAGRAECVNVFVYSGGSTFSGLLNWLVLLLVVFQRRYPSDC